MKILLIEDENLIANEMKRTLHKLRNDIEVVATIKSIEEGVEWFEKQHVVDLIISDIQLIDGTSFELFKLVNTKTPIIFTTAYDDFALRAFKLNSIDYLMKPVKETELELALNKYNDIYKKDNNLTTDVLSELISKNKSYRTKFLVKLGDQFRQVNTSEICFFYAEGNTVYLVKNDNRKLIVDYSLETVCEELDPKDYFRVNRHLIISNKSIKKIHKYFNSRLKLEIQPEFNSDVLVSRSRVNEFLEWLNY